jgi:periplasmic protein CpxP/Spy
MNLSPEAAEAVQNELKRFAADLNLTEDQKTRLRTALENARAKLDEVRKNNPDISKADIVAKVKEARGPSIRPFSRATSRIIKQRSMKRT